MCGSDTKQLEGRAAGGEADGFAPGTGLPQGRATVGSGAMALGSSTCVVGATQRADGLAKGRKGEGKKTADGVFQELKTIQEAPRLLRLKEPERGERQSV